MPIAAAISSLSSRYSSSVIAAGAARIAGLVVTPCPALALESCAIRCRYRPLAFEQRQRAAGHRRHRVARQARQGVQVLWPAESPQHLHAQQAHVPVGIGHGGAEKRLVLFGGARAERAVARPRLAAPRTARRLAQRAARLGPADPS